MTDPTDFSRMPGLYRLWDLQFIVTPRHEFRIHYVETTEDGAPLFAVYRRTLPEIGARS